MLKKYFEKNKIDVKRVFEKTFGEIILKRKDENLLRKYFEKNKI